MGCGSPFPQHWDPQPEWSQLLRVRLPDVIQPLSSFQSTNCHLFPHTRHDVHPHTHTDTKPISLTLPSRQIDNAEFRVPAFEFLFDERSGVDRPSLTSSAGRSVRRAACFSALKDEQYIPSKRCFFLPDCAASHSGRQKSALQPSWELRITISTSETFTFRAHVSARTPTHYDSIPPQAYDEISSQGWPRPLPHFVWTAQNVEAAVVIGSYTITLYRSSCWLWRCVTLTTHSSRSACCPRKHLKCENVFWLFSCQGRDRTPNQLWKLMNCLFMETYMNWHYITDLFGNMTVKVRIAEHWGAFVKLLLPW
jgi:hypothetical protein